MSALHGRITFNASSGRSPWDGLTADGDAIVGGPDDPLAAVAVLDRLSRLHRYVGYLSYDLGRSFEVLPALAKDDHPIPPLAFVEATHPSPEAVDERVEDDSSAATTQLAVAKPTSTFSRPAYESAVRRSLDYIAAGDVFQINLSQRLAINTRESPALIYRRLRDRFPSEFGAFLNFGRFQLISNSPELFLRVTRLSDGRRKIVNRPIKGTRPNAPGMYEALLTSEKDKAELAMIVDLQRNDLGRICEIASVVVTEPRMIEMHPTVLHGVATIEGILREGISLTDILRATFPCGSVTGCPKIRAMEIIDELEPIRRGAYCGAIGWIHDGEMEFSVAIRTMTIVDGVAYVPVGGGIVADSVPYDEYNETITKAAAMLAALGAESC